MSKNIAYKVELLDCTIRDGGYVNNWAFDRKLVRETYRALSKAGVDFVEIGYHGSDKYFDRQKYGEFRRTPADVVKEISKGIAGSPLSLMVDYGKYNLKDLEQYIDTPVKLVRIAFHRDKIKESLTEAMKIKKMGFMVSVNLMGYSSYTNDERDQLLALFHDLPVDYAYVSDTYGSMFPPQISEFYEPLVKIKHIKWGFHPHNNLQMAFANSLAAIDSGTHIIDSSIYGMGRGAGNLPTEIMLSFLQISNPERYNVIPVLNIIDHYYSELKKKYNWGYDLPYMISGIYGCHPDYPKNLVDRKEYDIEDIWTVLKLIKTGNPAGYKKELIEEILKKGLFGKKKASLGLSYSVNDSHRVKSEVKYINRHPDSDFLIIANGSTINAYSAQISQFIDRYKPIVMAGNYIGSLFKPDYHGFNNKRRFVDYIGTVDKEAKLLIGEHIPREMIKEYTDRDYESIYYEDIQDVPFDIEEGRISSNCRTIALLLMGVAIVMGAKRIFVAGLDGYMNLKGGDLLHFYNETDETEDRDVLLDKHMGNLRYLEEMDKYLCDHGKEGIHIITPTNYAKYYKGLNNFIEVNAK